MDLPKPKEMTGKSLLVPKGSPIKPAAKNTASTAANVVILAAPVTKSKSVVKKGKGLKSPKWKR